MSYDIGPKIGIDGEAEFRKQISAVSTQLKTLGTEMGAVTAQFARNASGQEALSAKTAVLNKQIDAQKEKLALQQEMLEKAAAKYGAADERTQKWQQTVNRSTKELYDMENALNDAGGAMDDAGGSTITFGDLLKSNVIGNAIVEGIKTVAGAIRDMAGDFIESAASVKAQTAQFEQTFGSLGGEADAAINRVADASGILATRLQGTGTQIYAFARSAGGDTAQSMDIMERALKVAADSAAYYDRSLEDTTESLQSFLKGNYSNDAALGLSATETTRNAAAMELFGQKFSELTEIQKQDTLLKMVEDSMKLSGAMGQAQREADGWENVQGNLTEAWKQFQAAVGTSVLENLIPLIQKGTETLQNLTENINWTAFSDSVSTAFEGIAELASGISDAVLAAAQIPEVSIIFENLATVVATLTATMIAYKASTAISGAIDALKVATESQTVAQAALNAVMNANPFVLVATLIAGVVTALVTLYKTNDEFREKVNSAWASVKETVSNVVSYIKNGWNSLKDKAKEVGESIITFFRELPDTMKSIGCDLVQGLIDGVTGMVDNVKSAVKNVADKAVNTIKDVLGIHSPSRVFMTIGEYLMDGLEIGMENGKGKVMETVEDIAGEVTDRFRTLTSALDTQSDISDLQYQLWEMTAGKNAGELERYDKKLELLTEQEATQAGVLEATQAVYQSMADQYGVNSAEALSYMKTLLQEQIEYQKLADSIQEVLDKQRELSMTTNVTASYADIAGTMRSGVPDLDTSLSRAAASMVNGMSTVMGGRTEYVGTTVLAIDGREFARVTQPYYRSEDRSNPEVVSDV